MCPGRSDDADVSTNMAFSYQCMGCLSKDSTVCEEVPVECDEDQCMTASQIYYHGDRKFKSILKGCAIKSLCGVYGSVTQDPSVRIRVYATCCKGKKCNNGKFYIPEDNTTQNGLQCPSAYCPGTTEDCDKETKMMDCRGDETCCIEYRGRKVDPGGYEEDYSVKGCINEIGCELNFQGLLGVKERERKLLKCCKKDKSYP